MVFRKPITSAYLAGAGPTSRPSCARSSPIEMHKRAGIASPARVTCGPAACRPMERSRSGRLIQRQGVAGDAQPPHRPVQGCPGHCGDHLTCPGPPVPGAALCCIAKLPRFMHWQAASVMHPRIYRGLSSSPLDVGIRGWGAMAKLCTREQGDGALQAERIRSVVGKRSAARNGGQDTTAAALAGGSACGEAGSDAAAVSDCGRQEGWGRRR